NEEAIAKSSIETILPYLETLPYSTTLLIVNDGSKDRTVEIVRVMVDKVGDKSRFTMVSHNRNQGYGAGLRTGMRYAIDNGYDYALFMDSDLTNHPKYLTLFYDKMTQGCEYIKATRYTKGGGMEGVAFKRRMFSRIGNMVGGFLFQLPLTDVTNGFRAVKAEILKQLHLKENGFPIIMEELCQAKRLARSFCEVPYILTDRKAGQGDTHFPYTLRTMVTYLCYALIAFFYGRPK
ncbi:MAG: Dolichol-phosphate mannosyltransferase, partial [Parcubacteria group bacterium GW2011_GWC2_45_7]